MAQALIEVYRGWDISFDTENQTFIVYSNYYDEEQVGKKSYEACKKYIDDFIKANDTFKPIVVCKPPSAYYSLDKKTLTGIRRDGIFIYNGDKGKKKTLSKYDEDDYFIYQPWMEDVFAEMTEIGKKMTALKDQKKAIMEGKFTPKAKTVKDYKKENFTNQQP